MTTKHLWEVGHSYYCAEGNYYTNDANTEYDSFADFFSEWKDVDMDYNMIFRWDWKEEDAEGEPNYNGDDYYRNGTLCLYYMGQRKAKSWSVEVSVCRADEAVIIEFLTPYWEYMRALWEPLNIKETTCNPSPSA